MDWQHFPYQYAGLEKHLERIREKKSKLIALRPLSSGALKNIRDSLALEWTYHSNGIEGNTLNLRETRMVLEDGMTIRGKTMREHFEALNHREAIAYVENLALSEHPLSAADVLDVHKLVLQKIEQDFAGRYRNSGVRIAGTNFVPPNALKVDALMNELIGWYNGPGTNIPTLIKVAIFHHRFVWIHPFFDGNGRTVRLLFNLLLIKVGYPPAIILKNDRHKYYQALNQANQGHYAKIVQVVLQAVERSLDIYLSNLMNNYEDYQPISDLVEEPGFPYGQEYISLLARQGKIDAFKEARNWVTTKAAVLDYMEKRARKRVRNA